MYFSPLACLNSNKLASDHFLRECVESGALDVGHIPTDFNIADLFTKALEPKKFRLFRAAVMNLPIETLRA